MCIRDRITTLLASFETRLSCGEALLKSIELASLEDRLSSFEALLGNLTAENTKLASLEDRLSSSEALLEKLTDGGWLCLAPESSSSAAL